MALNSDITRSLSYLRRKYKVSERDLVALAKRLNKHDEEPEVTWEEIVQRTLRNRQGRFTSQTKRMRNGF
jgi:hypothetical protein